MFNKSKTEDEYSKAVKDLVSAESDYKIIYENVIPVKNEVNTLTELVSEHINNRDEVMEKVGADLTAINEVKEIDAKIHDINDRIAILTESLTRNEAQAAIAREPLCSAEKRAIDAYRDNQNAKESKCRESLIKAIKKHLIQSWLLARGSGRQIDSLRYLREVIDNNFTFHNFNDSEYLENDPLNNIPRTELLTENDRSESSQKQHRATRAIEREHLTKERLKREEEQEKSNALLGKTVSNGHD